MKIYYLFYFLRDFTYSKAFSATPYLGGVNEAKPLHGQAGYDAGRFFTGIGKTIARN